jgi:hypothetical protein
VFADDIRRAVRYERGLAVKFAFVLLLVAAAVLARIYLFA